MSNMDDVFWGSDSDDHTTSSPHGINGDGNLPQNDETIEIRKLRQVHSKRGYLDGISSAKEENLQTGFDDSFPQGALLGMKVGGLLGKLQALAATYGSEDEELQKDFLLAQKELRINKVLTKTNFDENYNLVNDEHPVIVKWEQTLRKYSEKYF